MQANWDAAIAAGYTPDDINQSGLIVSGASIWGGFPEPTPWHLALDHFHLRFGVPTEALAKFDPSQYDTTVGLLEAIKALADGSRS
jgi:hypothetical protein